MYRYLLAVLVYATICAAIPKPWDSKEIYKTPRKQHPNDDYKVSGTRHARAAQITVSDLEAETTEVATETPEVKPPIAETPDVKPTIAETPEVKPTIAETPEVKPTLTDTPEDTRTTIAYELEGRSVAQPTPRFYSKLSYFHKNEQDRLLVNLLDSKSHRRKFRSKCRCEKISNCPKLQMSVGRCPEEYFMCCF